MPAGIPLSENVIIPNMMNAHNLYKYLWILALGILSLTPIYASGGNDNPDRKPVEKVRVAALAGPSGVGMAYLIANKPTLGHDAEVSFEVAPSVDVLLPKLINGDIDIGILPPNVAAKLYTMNRKSIVVGAVVGKGMLSVVTRDTTTRSLKDLVGKRVVAAGQGSTPEYVFKALCARNGIPTDAIDLDFSIPTPEIAAALVSGKIEYALIPEPFATVALMNGGAGDRTLRRAIAISDEWSKAGLGNDFPMTLCVIRADFARARPDAVRDFLAAYRESIEWTVANSVEASKFVEQAGIGIKAPLAAKAIPHCGLVYIPATDAKKEIEELLNVFLTYSPESVGKKLPDAGFYLK